MGFNTLKIICLTIFFPLLLVMTAGTSFAAITNPSPCPATLPAGFVGAAYSFTFTGTNGTGQPWSISSGSLPSGLTLSTAGVLSGTPAAGSAGTYTFTVLHKETKGQTSSCNCTLVIMDGCSFSTGNTGSISFGDVNPTGTGVVVGSVTAPVQFICSTGTTYTVSVNPASGWELAYGSNTMVYNLGVVTDGTGTGAAVDVFTTGGSTLAQSQYVNASAGIYANASGITVVISYTGGSLTAFLPAGSVTANVQTICAASGSSLIDFGTLDAMTHAGGAVAAVTPPVLVCTKDASVNITGNGGLHYSGTPRLRDASINYIHYTVNFTNTLTGAGGATDIGGSGPGKLSLSADISAGALDNAPEGTYTDTVTLTITY